MLQRPDLQKQCCLVGRLRVKFFNRIVLKKAIGHDLDREMTRRVHADHVDSNHRPPTTQILIRPLFNSSKILDSWWQRSLVQACYSSRQSSAFTKQQRRQSLASLARRHSQPNYGLAEHLRWFPGPRQREFKSAGSTRSTNTERVEPWLDHLLHVCYTPLFEIGHVKSWHSVSSSTRWY